MNHLLALIIGSILWWKWFLWDQPNMARLILSGVDKQSRRIIYARHDAAEPTEWRPK